MTAKALRTSHRRYLQRKRPARRFRELRYRTRSQILKLAASVRITARRVWLAFASGYPHQAAFAAVLRQLHNNPAHAPPG